MISAADPAPKLRIIMGCMFSGKTTNLIKTVQELPAKDVLVINHISDTRYSTEMLSTNDNIQIRCIFLEKLASIPTAAMTARAKYIFINEAQFFPDLYDAVVQLLAANKSVFVYGLDGDYRKRPIGQILNLIPLCDSCEKLTAKCEVCGERAIFSKRISDSGPQILVGQKDLYIPTCRECFTK
jgi:thymidine kinase